VGRVAEATVLAPGYPRNSVGQSDDAIAVAMARNSNHGHHAQRGRGRATATLKRVSLCLHW